MPLPTGSCRWPQNFFLDAHLPNINMVQLSSVRFACKQVHSTVKIIVLMVSFTAGCASSATNALLLKPRNLTATSNVTRSDLPTKPTWNKILLTRSVTQDRQITAGVTTTHNDPTCPNLAYQKYLRKSPKPAGWFQATVITLLQWHNWKNKSRRCKNVSNKKTTSCCRRTKRWVQTIFTFFCLRQSIQQERIVLCVWIVEWNKQNRKLIIYPPILHLSLSIYLLSLSLFLPHILHNCR